jgi:hypothetical protein
MSDSSLTVASVVRRATPHSPGRSVGDDTGWSDGLRTEPRANDPLTAPATEAVGGSSQMEVPRTRGIHVCTLSVSESDPRVVPVRPHQRRFTLTRLVPRLRSWVSRRFHVTNRAAPSRGSETRRPLITEPRRFGYPRTTTRSDRLPCASRTTSRRLAFVGTRTRFNRYSSYHDTEPRASECESRRAVLPPITDGLEDAPVVFLGNPVFAREDRTYIRLRRQRKVTLPPNSCARCGFETDSASSDAERDSRTASVLPLYLRNRSRNDRRVLTEHQ